MNNRIKSVDPMSIADEMGIEAGDKLVEINGKPIVDVLDFLYFMDDDELELVIEKPTGEEWVLDIEKDFDEVLGLNFEKPILDEAKRCTNQCVFCFIDQLPQGMRDTLYFKDDDSRLSFLMGNFVTLTNMNDETFARIIDYHVSPINISVHTVDEAKRVEMLGNRHAGKIKDRLLKLAQAGIEMNGQVVLCPGFNDGTYLDETIDFMAGLYPHMNSMAVVPIGLTKFRDNLPQVQAVDGPIADQVIEQIGHWQTKLLKSKGTRFVFAADEFFLKANRPLPAEAYYEGYVQIENGVGLLRKFEDQAQAALKQKSRCGSQSVLVVTSVGASAMMASLVDKVNHQFGKTLAQSLAIENHFFGESITVAGLMTGGDIIKQVKAYSGFKYNRILLSESVVNTDGVFLDDMTPEEVAKALKTPVVLVPVDGGTFIDEVVGG